MISSVIRKEPHANRRVARNDLFYDQYRAIGVAERPFRNAAEQEPA